MPTKLARAELLHVETGEVIHAFPVEVVIGSGDQPSVHVRALLPGVREDLDGKRFRMRLASITDDVTTQIKVNAAGPSTVCTIWLEGAAWRSSDWIANL